MAVNPQIDPLTGKFKQSGAALNAILDPTDPNGPTTQVIDPKSGLDSGTYNVDAFNKAKAAYDKKVKENDQSAVPPNKSNFVNPGATNPNIQGSVHNYNSRYGGTPDVPNPNVAADQSIKGNLANFGDLTNLTTKTNDLMAGEYTSRLPGYSDLANQNSLNIGAQLRGEVPQDVINQIGQQSAERGIGGGVSGSQFSNSDFLRSLGLTSIGQQKEGAANYDRSLGRIKDIPTFDPSSMFTRPEDLYQAGLQQNIFDAAPVPGIAGKANAYDAMAPFRNQTQIENTAASKKLQDDMDTLLQAQRVGVGNPTGR